MSDVRAEVDAFLAARKDLVGEAAWHYDGHLPPLLRQLVEIDGTVLGELDVRWISERPSPVFKIRLAYRSSDVWRLDHNPAAHAVARKRKRGFPPIIQGAHYHAWADNREYATPARLPQQLFHMRPFPPGGVKLRNFDDIYRWFCSEVNIAVREVPMLPISGLL